MPRNLTAPYFVPATKNLPRSPHNAVKRAAATKIPARSVSKQILPHSLALSARITVSFLLPLAQREFPATSKPWKFEEGRTQTWLFHALDRRSGAIKKNAYHRRKLRFSARSSQNDEAHLPTQLRSTAHEGAGGCKSLGRTWQNPNAIQTAAGDFAIQTSWRFDSIPELPNSLKSPTAIFALAGNGFHTPRASQWSHLATVSNSVHQNR